RAPDPDRGRARRRCPREPEARAGPPPPRRRGDRRSRDRAPQGEGPLTMAEERVEKRDIQVSSSASRCPFCHAEVVAERATTCVCASCLARHHVACWREHKACSSCGSTDELVPRRSVPLVTPAAPPGESRLGIKALVAAGVAVALLAVGYKVRDDEQRRA